MKKILSLVVLLISLGQMPSTHAQPIYRQDKTNPDIYRHVKAPQMQRKEFHLPDVNGYHVYKADLHLHTMFSDGNVTPEFRVQEAWYDGLDVIAITDHVEGRKWEGKMLKFLKGYLPKGTVPVNDRVSRQPADKRGIQADLNVSYQSAAAVADEYGMTVIPGAEITREPVAIGHFNALFIKDANKIYDANPAVAIENARQQGALIQHNHPGWRRTSVKMTEFETQVYEKGYINGIEVMNGVQFYPSVLQRAQERRLYVAANTDMHLTTQLYYQGEQRNMTLIFAKDKSLQSLKEALKERRTLAYSFGTVAGDEQLVKDFFLACIHAEVIKTDANGKHKVMLTNNSSVDFHLNFNGNSVCLDACSSRVVSAGKSLSFIVDNLWIPGDARHPRIVIPIQ
ncbi:MAG: PHP domain-containing protein [Prevotellaceae bacterium]|nr:PHP domain-containing protein [Prevotellaceae bacterium]